MKHLITIILLVLFSGTIYSQNTQVEVIMKDGSKHEGFAKMPSFSTNNISFKTEESGKALSIKSKDIKTLIFTTDKGTVEMEFLYCRMNEKIVVVVEWGWLTVVTRGAVTTYTGNLPKPPGDRRSSNNNFLYCHREGEKYAEAISAIDVFGTAISGIGFSGKMSKYFSDYPELSEKIKEKADGYKFNNIKEIIAEYNAWKEN